MAAFPEEVNEDLTAPPKAEPAKTSQHEVLRIVAFDSLSAEQKQQARWVATLR